LALGTLPPPLCTLPFRSPISGIQEFVCVATPLLTQVRLPLSTKQFPSRAPLGFFTCSNIFRHRFLCTLWQVTRLKSLPRIMSPSPPTARGLPARMFLDILRQVPAPFSPLFGTGGLSIPTPSVSPSCVARPNHSPGAPSDPLLSRGGDGASPVLAFKRGRTSAIAGRLRVIVACLPLGRHFQSCPFILVVLNATEFVSTAPVETCPFESVGDGAVLVQCSLVHHIDLPKVWNIHAFSVPLDPRTASSCMAWRHVGRRFSPCTWFPLPWSALLPALD